MDKKDKEAEFELDDEEEYEVKRIQESTVYVKESEEGHLPGLYYLVSWKCYLEEKNISEPVSRLNPMVYPKAKIIECMV